MEIINLDMTPSTVTPNAHAGQYDSARTVRFMLKNGGVPFTLAGTEIITAEITRSDNTEVTVNVANTSSNYVDVVFDDTVCTVKGLYACELRVVDGGVDIGSKNFALLVQRDPYDGAGVHVETVGPADICTFKTTLPEPLQSVLVNVEATGGYDADTQTAHPINGYTEANITRCGVNLFNKTDNTIQNNARIATGSGGTYGAAGYSVSPYIKVDSSKPYVLTSGIQSYFAGYDENKTFIGGGSWNTGASKTFLSTVVYIRFDFQTPDTDTVQLEQGSTATPYAPYTGNTYTIAFGQTVYGGVLDVTRGKLRVTHGYVDLGSLNWIYNSTVPVFHTNIPSMLRPSNLLCASYQQSFEPQIENVPDKTIWNSRYAFTPNNLCIKDTTYSDTATFKTAMNGVMLVYELATPFDIDLTPEVISAIVGVNNVFADCGQTTVKYLKAGV